MDTIGWLAAIGGLGGFLMGLGAIIAGVVQWRRARSDTSLTNANASERISAAALSLIEPYQKELVALRGEMKSLQEQITRQSVLIASLHDDLRARDSELEGLRAGVVVLTSQLKRLKIVPEYTPEETLHE